MVVFLALYDVRAHIAIGFICSYCNRIVKSETQATKEKNTYGIWIHLFTLVRFVLLFRMTIFLSTFSVYIIFIVIANAYVRLLLLHSLIRYSIPWTIAMKVIIADAMSGVSQDERWACDMRINFISYHNL